MVFELYTAGEPNAEGVTERLGSFRIAKRLNGMGIKTKRGNAWFTASVRELLIDPVYAGKTFWKRRPAEKKREHGLPVEKRSRDLSKF